MKGTCETDEFIINALWSGHLDYNDPHHRPPGHWGRSPPVLVDDIDTHATQPNQFALNLIW